jgi:hypothetical protein
LALDARAQVKRAQAVGTGGAAMMSVFRAAAKVEGTKIVAKQKER